MYKICYVEDEVDLNNVVTKYLEKAEYEVYSYNYPRQINFEIDYDLYILDIMFNNDISGYELLSKIKNKDINSLVIFTSARDADVDRIKGLELGCDDYISKPFSPRELVLRCNLLLKRNKNTIFTQNNYRIDLANRLVYENDDIVILTTKEFDLLNLLINNKRKIISRDEILESLWGNEYDGSYRVVDDLIRRLRQKMPNLSLETIYGKGYQLL